MKKFILLFIFLAGFIFFILPSGASAEITHPYVVDEKPQILDSDSIPIITPNKTYFGLENYTQDYVGGYAHFTFTYSHHMCCFASPPPRVYLTHVDPRPTAVPGAQDFSDFAYFIPAFSGIATDWYLYDV